MKSHRSKYSLLRKSSRGAAAALALLALTLVGCRPQQQPDPASVDRVGLVLLSQATEVGAPAGQATFVELTTKRAEELMGSPFGAQVGTCDVSAAAAPTGGSVIGAPSGNRLLAGTIQLLTGATAYGSLERGPDGRYSLPAALAPLPTDGLSLQLAATGAFPAFNNVTVATGKTPTLQGFDAANITVNTRFGWTPGGANSAIILVGSDGTVAFSCVADDSLGAFSFPEATRAELTNAGFGTGSLDTLGRLTTTQARASSALLVVGALRLVNLGTEP